MLTVYIYISIYLYTWLEDGLDENVQHESEYYDGERDVDHTE